MSQQPLSTAIVPVSADEIARRSYEQRYLIEERVVSSLVEVINQGIRDQVSHGMLEYEYCVPSFIYGFPKFDVDYVGNKLRTLYACRGFLVSGSGRWTRVEWTPGQPQPQQPPQQQQTTTTPRRGQAPKQKQPVVLLPSLPPS